VPTPVKISGLPAGTSVTDVDLFVGVQAGTTVKLTGLQVKTYAGGGTGDVVGPASATDNAVTRFDTTTGKLVQNSAVTISDAGAIVAPEAGSVIPFYFANQAAFPPAATSHGAVAHSHADGAMYFAHGGSWVRLLEDGGPLGTPSSGTLTNATGLPIASGVNGLGTNVATALGVNVGSAGAMVVYGGVLGTPSSGTLTNATGLPLSTGVTGNLPVSNLNGGTGATATTFWRGDGVWATPAGGGGSSTILESANSITQNYTITNGTNGLSVLPVTIASGVSVTVGSGQVWMTLG